MTQSTRHGSTEPGDWAALEATIRAAGKYVVPGDDLRPRTLEAARQWSADRRGLRKLRRLMAAALVCSLLSVQLVDYLRQRDNRIAPTPQEFRQRAMELASNANVGPHWGVVEAFSQLRRAQAARFGQSSATN